MPCARNSTPVSLWASSSNTSTKVRPMILRFCSGSVTPASAVRNRCSASTRITRTPRCSANVLHHLIAFAQTQQAVIDEHADELIADRAMQQRSDDRGVHATGQPEQHLAVCRPARGRARSRPR